VRQTATASLIVFRRPGGGAGGCGGQAIAHGALDVR